MKYRVNFECYWYNTGSGDNRDYINSEDFDTLEEAEKFKDRVNEQYFVSKKRIVYPTSEDSTEYEKKYNLTITSKEHDEWKNKFQFIEVDNGYITSEGSIVKFYPSREEPI